jgi:hypothetical protein
MNLSTIEIDPAEAEERLAEYEAQVRRRPTPRRRLVGPMTLAGRCGW